MDGNGRWAQRRGLPRSEGHKAGTEAAKAVVTRCRELGIGHLTLYTFSKENWGRPKEEVSFLFDLLTRSSPARPTPCSNATSACRFSGSFPTCPWRRAGPLPTSSGKPPAAGPCA
jgi:undecaprenyl diphosphate synthase